MIQYSIIPVSCKMDRPYVPNYNDLVDVLNDYGRQGYYLVGNPIGTYMDSPIVDFITYDYIAYQIIQES